MSKFFIEHPIFANVIAIITIIIGAVCIATLPISQYPEITPPTIQVSTSMPGASAETVAKTIGVPIEQAVNGVEGAMYMSSTSGSDGSYTLTISFDVGSNLNTALSLVQNYVNTALAQLPAGANAQGITVRKVSTNILLVINLYSDSAEFDEKFLANYAIINMQYPLARLPGVGQVKVVGAGKYSMRVWLDPNKLQYFGLTTLDVERAIEQQNVEVVAGQLGGPPVPKDQAFQFTVNALGRLSDIEEFQNIIVKTRRDNETAQIVRIRDLARVELSQQTFANFSQVYGKPAAHIVFYTLPGANDLDVAKSVLAEVEKMKAKFPEGMHYASVYNTTKFVQQAISSVYHTLFEAAILVLIVIMVFLQNFRAMLVPATTVPVTIIGAFAAMAALGFSINLMTLFALILAIGIVVDDAIIIVENASHYIEKGLTPKDAAIKAMSELTGPVIGITLVLISVFLPAAFLPGISGQLFRQFALVIAATAVISALNAVTLKPAQCALYLRARKEGYRPNAFYRGFNRVYSYIERFYVGIVSWMAHRTGLMLLVFFTVIVIAGWRFSQQPGGFLPTEDQGYCIVATKLPDGAAQPRARAVVEKINAIVSKEPGVGGWVTIGGLSILDGANLSTAVTTFVTYKDWSERGSELSQAHIVASLRQKLASIEDAFVFVLIPPPIRGLGQSGGFQMMVEDRSDLGLTELDKVARELTAAGNGQTGLVGLATTYSARSPQLFLDIDRTKVESLGVSTTDVFATLQGYLGSAYVNLFNKFNQVYQVYVQADAPFRLHPDDIRSLYVRNNQDQVVPLGTLMSARTVLSSELITRYNLYPAAPIFGASAPGFSSGQGLSLMEQVAENTLPSGMDYEWTATALQEKHIGNTAYFIYALSLTLVFLVLAAQYESWTSPAAVILTVPMALVGVLLALIIRGFDNNLYTQVGLILMIALAAKNAILIVEFARELRAEGMPIVESAIEATRRRFRPILMTSFAFILGVVPMATASGAGAASQQALGTVVVGGMLASTLFAIPFVSVFYITMQRISERRSAKKGAQVQTPSPPPSQAPAE
ncbi:MAG: efflux RND transporter permease subunit [Rhodospirillales bacterium]|nr:efflux RND transporter permease subunit [Rhodospirillales bacterium]